MANTNTPPAAPATEATKAPKAPKVQQPSIFPTAEAATKEAEGRTKGPRRAFTCVHNGKMIHVVANNEGRAGGIAFGEIGGTVSEIGKVKKAKAPAGVSGILEAVGQLPEAERATVMKQLEALLKASTKK